MPRPSYRSASIEQGARSAVTHRASALTGCGSGPLEDTPLRLQPGPTILDGRAFLEGPTLALDQGAHQGHQLGPLLPRFGEKSALLHLVANATFGVGFDRGKLMRGEVIEDALVQVVVINVVLQG